MLKLLSPRHVSEIGNPHDWDLVSTSLQPKKNGCWPFTLSSGTVGGYGPLKGGLGKLQHSCWTWGTAVLQFSTSTTTTETVRLLEYTRHGTIKLVPATVHPQQTSTRSSRQMLVVRQECVHSNNYGCSTMRVPAPTLAVPAAPQLSLSRAQTPRPPLAPVDAVRREGHRVASLALERSVVVAQRAVRIQCASAQRRARHVSRRSRPAPFGGRVEDWRRRWVVSGVCSVAALPELGGCHAHARAERLRGCMSARPCAAFLG